MRIGIGYDVHRLVEGRALILGGEKVRHTMGLLGHSDADVLTHAIMDALLGAIGAGDIGRLFPDTDPQYEGISSLSLLKQCMEHVRMRGYEVGNIDAVVIAQKPKISPYTDAMRQNIAAICGCSPEQINIKATTEEHLGFTGREEGIASQAVCLLVRAPGESRTSS